MVYFMLEIKGLLWTHICADNIEGMRTEGCHTITSGLVSEMKRQQKLNICTFDCSDELALLA